MKISFFPASPHQATALEQLAQRERSVIITLLDTGYVEIEAKSASDFFAFGTRFQATVFKLENDVSGRSMSPRQEWVLTCAIKLGQDLIQAHHEDGDDFFERHPELYESLNRFRGLICDPGEQESEVDA